nr:MAG TPA: hypothetical protein [Caudoviricetes sp.]
MWAYKPGNPWPCSRNPELISLPRINIKRRWQISANLFIYLMNTEALQIKRY